MNRPTTTELALLAFAIPAALSAWHATKVFNAILQGLAPNVTVGYETRAIFGMVFSGLTSLALPMIILLASRNNKR